MDTEAQAFYQPDKRLQRARHLIDLSRYGDAVNLATEVLQDDPEDTEALGVLACALLYSRRYYEAITHAQKAAVADPLSEYPHRLLAFAFLGAGQKKEALEAAREAVRLAPEASGAQWALYKTLYDNHKWKEALEIAEFLTRLFPEDGDSHHARSEAHYALRQWAMAELAARDGLAIQPDIPDLHIALARALWKLKNRSESLIAYRRAVLADPGYSEAAKVLSDQVGRYIMPLERAVPWYLWICLTSVLCWYAHRLLGWWPWWGLLWSVLLLYWNTLYLCSEEIWITRFTRRRYVEMPTEVQRHLWIAGAFHPSLTLWAVIFGLGLATILLLVFWTLFPARSPAPLTGWKVAAVLYLIGLGISALTILIRFGTAGEAIEYLKPADLTKPAEESIPDWMRHVHTVPLPHDSWGEDEL